MHRAEETISRPGDRLVLGRWKSGSRLGAVLAAAAGLGLLAARGMDPFLGENFHNWKTAFAALAAAALFWTGWSLYARGLRLELRGSSLRLHRFGRVEEIAVAHLTDVRWRVNGDGPADVLDFLGPAGRVLRIPDVFDPAKLKPLFEEILRQNPSLRLDEGLRKRLETVTP
ncbi:MAG: hypothetical protein ACT4O3_01315 [Elusimicrobiota bacterium]